MADAYFKMNGNVMIQKENGIESQFFHGPNHDFEIRAENSPIVGTNNSTEDNATSDQLAIYNQNTKLWGINESGWVQNPNAPAFSVTRDSGVWTSGVLIHNKKHFDNCNNYDTSTGYFTAPIDGVYYISTFLMSNNNATYNNTYYRLYINSTVHKNVYSSNGGSLHHQFNWAGAVQLSAGDYVYLSYGNVQIYGSSTLYVTFSGFLVG